MPARSPTGTPSNAIPPASAAPVKVWMAVTEFPKSDATPSLPLDWTSQYVISKKLKSHSVALARERFPSFPFILGLPVC